MHLFHIPHRTIQKRNVHMFLKLWNLRIRQKYNMKFWKKPKYATELSIMGYMCIHYQQKVMAL